MQHRVINKNLSYESPPGPPLYTNNTKFVKRLKQLNFSKSCPNLLDHHRIIGILNTLYNMRFPIINVKMDNAH